MISDQELAQLVAWLSEHERSDIPAIDFLAVTVRAIVTKGSVTKEGRAELYEAIELILPPQARKIAKARRTAEEAAIKQQERLERDTLKAEERRKRELNRPVESANFMVAGVRHEGRAGIIERYVRPGDPVFLSRDTANRFSRNAIAILLRNGRQIRFVPEDDARLLASLLDSGHKHVASVTKVLRGGRVPIPVVQAYLYRADAEIQGVITQAGIPKPSGCGMWLVALALAIVLAALVGLKLWLFA